MKRFEVTVVREGKFIVEIDETVINEKEISAFNDYMYPTENLQEYAEYLAKAHVYDPEARVLEGFGCVTRNGQLPGLPRAKDEMQPRVGLNIEIEWEDEWEVSSFEIKEGGDQ